MKNIGRGFINNWIYPGPTGWVLVDSGYSGDLTWMKTKVKKLGLSLTDISCLFLTHAHDDHAGGLKALMTICPELKIIVGEKSVETLKAGRNPAKGAAAGRSGLLTCLQMAKTEHRRHTFPPLSEEDFSHCLIITDENRGGAEELLGGKIIETPGHTGDSLSLFLNDGRLLCGDAAMNDYPSTNHITIWVENVDAYKASWEKIIALKPRMIYPGHGRPFTVKSLREDLPKIETLPYYVPGRGGWKKRQ